jgi:hypothetical protein
VLMVASFTLRSRCSTPAATAVAAAAIDTQQHKGVSALPHRMHLPAK